MDYLCDFTNGLISILGAIMAPIQHDRTPATHLDPPGSEIRHFYEYCTAILAPNASDSSEYCTGRMKCLWLSNPPEVILKHELMNTDTSGARERAKLLLRIPFTHHSGSQVYLGGNQKFKILKILCRMVLILFLDHMQKSTKENNKPGIGYLALIGKHT